MSMTNKIYQLRSLPSGMVVCHFEKLSAAKAEARNRHDYAKRNRALFRDGKEKRHFEVYKLEKVFSTERRK